MPEECQSARGVPGCAQIRSQGPHLGDDRARDFAPLPGDPAIGLLRVPGRVAAPTLFPSSRRGAPDTFDPVALRAKLSAISLRSASPSAEVLEEVTLPSFEHSVGDPVDHGVTFRRSQHEVVIVEGLYLLHDDHSWEGLCDLFDYRVHLTCGGGGGVGAGLSLLPVESIGVREHRPEVRTGVACASGAGAGLTEVGSRGEKRRSQSFSTWRSLVPRSPGCQIRRGPRSLAPPHQTRRLHRCSPKAELCEADSGHRIGR